MTTVREPPVVKFEQAADGPDEGVHKQLLQFSVQVRSECGAAWSRGHSGYQVAQSRSNSNPTCRHYLTRMVNVNT